MPIRLKLKKKDIRISVLEDINLYYRPYAALSKNTRKLCTQYNRERRKLFALRHKVKSAMIKDYYRQVKPCQK